MAGIFISYRRADSDGWAGRLRDALRARFGNRVFQDVESIADGEIFSEVIDRALQECDVALIIIGPNWASARNDERPPPRSERRLGAHRDRARARTAEDPRDSGARRRRVDAARGGPARRAAVADQEAGPRDPQQQLGFRRRAAREPSQTDRRTAARSGRRGSMRSASLARGGRAIGAFAGSRYFGQPAPSPTPAEPAARAAPQALRHKRRRAARLPHPSPFRLAEDRRAPDAPTEKPAASRTAAGSSEAARAARREHAPAASARRRRSRRRAARRPSRRATAAIRRRASAAARQAARSPQPKPRSSRARNPPRSAAPRPSAAARRGSPPLHPRPPQRPPAAPATDVASLNLPNRPPRRASSRSETAGPIG